MEKIDNNFRNFFNNIDDFLFVLDKQGNIIDTNEAVSKILGYTKEDLNGQSVLMVHPPEFREQALETVGKMIAGEVEKCPLPLLSKYGVYIPVETRVYQGDWNSEKVIIGVSRNLSELALSEEKFYGVFNNSNVLMALSEIESGVYVHVNKQFLQILGYAEKEIIGLSSQDLDLYYDFNQRLVFLERMNRGENVENEEVIVKTKSGDMLICLFTIKKIQIQTHFYWLTSADNITKLKGIEVKLRHGLRQQTLLADISKKLNFIDNFYESVDDVLFLLGQHTDVSRVYIFEDDEEGLSTTNTYEWCNTGVSQQKDLLQNVPYEMIPMWKSYLKEHGKIFSSNVKELPENIYRILEPQDIKSILVFPLYVEGRYSGFIGFDECLVYKTWEIDEVELLRTISNMISKTFELKISQQKLKESETQLKLAIENTDAGLWDWNISTGEVYFSDIWCKMLGYDKSEVEPNVKSWEKLVHPDDMPFINMVLTQHLEGKTDDYQTIHRLLTKSGKWKWVMDKGKVIEYDGDGRPTRAIGTHIDMDYQKKIEDELRKANTTKDKFFSIIAHDMLGPLGTLVKVTELISQKGMMSPEKMYSFLDNVKALTKNIFDLLTDLLSWAKINQEKVDFHPKNLNLNKIIKHNVDEIQLLANGKGITIMIKDAESFIVFADENMVDLVLRNLISNSVKFTKPDGEIVIEIVNDVSYDKQKIQFAKVRILDSGVGILPEDIQKILSDDIFYSTFGTKNEKGTGLGLKLCKEFIKTNGGVFNIESKINLGTICSFTLPLTEIQTN